MTRYSHLGQDTDLSVDLSQEMARVELSIWFTSGCWRECLAPWLYRLNLAIAFSDSPVLCSRPLLGGLCPNRPLHSSRPQFLWASHLLFMVGEHAWVAGFFIVVTRQNGSLETPGGRAGHLLHGIPHLFLLFLALVLSRIFPTYFIREMPSAH